MVDFTPFLANVALAAAMVGACGQAAATPLGYHVDVNTATLGTGPDFLDLHFPGLDGAPAATALAASRRIGARRR